MRFAEASHRLGFVVEAPHLDWATFAPFRVVRMKVDNEPPERVIGRIHRRHGS
jgi:hypothetical protein